MAKPAVTTLGADLGIADAATDEAYAATDEAYAAMDWLAARQDAIERKLARRHLAPAANPSQMALFDLSSSWLEGRYCPLGARGYSCDGKAGEAIGRYKMAKHFTVTITDDSLTIERKQDQIREEARLDGIYVIRTPVPTRNFGLGQRGSALI